METVTKHAQRRLQQRGLPSAALEVLLDFGSEKHVGKGCIAFAMNHAARKRARECLGAATFSRLEPHLNSYVILADDGVVVTAAHRYRRMKHR